MERRTCVVAFLCFSVCVATAQAKRIPPKEIDPVSHAGVTYRVVHFEFRNGLQNGGYVEAISDSDGKKKWGILLYLVKYDPRLEKDVQDCFITSLRLDEKKNRLVATNEAGHLYHVDLATQKVMHVISRLRTEK